MRMRRTLAAVLVAIGSVVLTALPAAAIEGTNTWTISYGSAATASGTTYVSGSKNYWRVAGTLKELGGNCGRVKVYEYTGDISKPRTKVKDVQACGRTSASFAVTGDIFRSFAYDVKYLYVEVCKENFFAPDYCNGKKFYTQ